MSELWKAQRSFRPFSLALKGSYHLTQALMSERIKDSVAQATNSSPVKDKSFLHRQTLPAGKSSVFPRRIMPQLQPSFFLASSKGTARQPSRQASLPQHESQGRRLLFESI